MCDYPAIYEEYVVKARKPHRCCECGIGIGTGEEYKRIKGLWDGRWDRFHQCLACVETWAEVDKEDTGFDCKEIGGLRDWVFGSGVSIPRSVLSHRFLMELDSDLDDPYGEWNYNLEWDDPQVRRFRNTRKWMQDPKNKEYHRELAEKTRLLNYLKSKERDGSIDDYGRKRLEGAFC